ncbi:MAG: electron transfer flavoprotein subunit alpha/FixB family protein [Bacteroidetes bacterium]|nr:electron transfer flavoprotein subunit alpha/FixB family protein [Bacteroidota bacterium]
MIGIYAENSEGIFKKAVLEAASYAKSLGDNVTAICISKPNEGEADKLAKYGINELVILEGISSFDAQNYAKVFFTVANQKRLQTIIIANTYEGKSLAPRISVLLNASLATNVVDFPNTTNGFTVKRAVFSGKGFAYVNLTRANKVIAITPNSIELKENNTAISVSTINAENNTKTTITGTSKTVGKIPLTEAEIVVSAGRGMKGPENWGMIEELALELGAATACSKPVSDMHWRPHSEHVGQTGITIKPNLYIAIGISGAIQHLAGVSSSKVIVAINKDPEAPFFKAADYGIVGDAFEILPQLLTAIKSGKN